MANSAPILYWTGAEVGSGILKYVAGEIMVYTTHILLVYRIDFAGNLHCSSTSMRELFQLGVGI